MNTKFPTDAEREVIEDELALWIESTDEEWDDHDIATRGMIKALVPLIAAREAEAVRRHIETKEIPSVRIENPEFVRPFMRREIQEARREAWDEGYQSGVNDERTSQDWTDGASTPARINPYRGADDDHT